MDGICNEKFGTHLYLACLIHDNPNLLDDVWCLFARISDDFGVAEQIIAVAKDLSDYENMGITKSVIRGGVESDLQA